MKRLFLFSGMGGDHRLFEKLRLPGVEVIAPDHIEPQEGEGLAAYSKRVAEYHEIKQADVVGGVSFGGMLAAQIANDRFVSGAVLIASCLGPHALPYVFGSAERVSRFIPDTAFKMKSWRPLIRARFYPITPEVENIVIAMGKDFPPEWLRRIGKMIAGWKGVPKPKCPTVIIQGAVDRIIPPDPETADVIILEAGHAFVLTHPKETSSAINEFIAKLSR